MTETVHDLGALRALREVGRQGSIAAAASVLGVSQQALSARMRTLERATGVTLLARTPSGSHLTEQGRLVVGWAEDVLDAAERLEAGLRSIRSGVSHRLAIAASQTIAEHLVPHWLVELRTVEQASGTQAAGGQGRAAQGPNRAAQGRAADVNVAPDAAEHAAGYPPTVVELTVANSTGVLALVRDGKAGLGFIETPHLPSDLVTGACPRRRTARGDRARSPVGGPPPAAGAGRDRGDAAGHAGGRQRDEGHADRSSRRPGSAAAPEDRDGARDQRRRQVGDRGRGRSRRAQPAGGQGRPGARPPGGRRGRRSPADQAAHRRVEARRSACARGTATTRRRHRRPVRPASPGRTSRTRCGRPGG